MSHVRKPLVAAATLNTFVFVVEGIAGYKAQSLTLIMDSVHNLSDELALVCLVLAYFLPIRLSRNIQRLANLLNSLGLFAISGFLVWWAIERILFPAPVMGMIPAVIGLLAAFGNWGVARSLSSIRNQNAAIYLAYLHNLSDIYVSLAPVAAGVLIVLTGRFFFDPLLALAVALWVIWTTLKAVIKSREELLWPEDAVCRHEPGQSAEVV